MCSDSVLGLVGTCDVQHGVQTAVVEGGAGYGHGAGLLVSPWVPGRVPSHVTEQGTTGKHPVKPVYEVGGSSCRPGREELEREKLLTIGDFVLEDELSIYTCTLPCMFIHEAVLVYVTIYIPVSAHLYLVYEAEGLEGRVVG